MNSNYVYVKPSSGVVSKMIIDRIITPIDYLHRSTIVVNGERRMVYDAPFEYEVGGERYFLS